MRAREEWRWREKKESSCFLPPLSFSRFDYSFTWTRAGKKIQRERERYGKRREARIREKTRGWKKGFVPRARVASSETRRGGGALKVNLRNQVKVVFCRFCTRGSIVAHARRARAHTSEIEDYYEDAPCRLFLSRCLPLFFASFCTLDRSSRTKKALKEMKELYEERRKKRIFYSVYFITWFQMLLVIRLFFSTLSNELLALKKKLLIFRIFLWVKFKSTLIRISIGFQRMNYLTRILFTRFENGMHAISVVGEIGKWC